LRDTLFCAITVGLFGVNFGMSCGLQFVL
jgi:hypothetical protein